MKNAIKYILQKVLGYQRYLFVFAKYKIRNLKSDKKEGDFFVGRTEFDSPEVDNEVLIDAATGYAGNGSFVHVKIDRAEDFDLYGTIV